MGDELKCKHCKFCFISQKGASGGTGKYRVDFIPTLSCKKGYKILEDGQPGCKGSDFEPRDA